MSAFAPPTLEYQHGQVCLTHPVPLIRRHAHLTCKTALPSPAPHTVKICNIVSSPFFFKTISLITSVTLHKSLLFSYIIIMSPRSTNSTIILRIYLMWLSPTARKQIITFTSLSSNLLADPV